MLLPRCLVRAAWLRAVLGMLLFFATSGVANALSEVWIGGQSSSDGRVNRYDTSGVLLGSFDNNRTVASIAVIPEPSTALLLALGLGGLGIRRRWFRRS